MLVNMIFYIKANLQMIGFASFVPHRNSHLIIIQMNVSLLMHCQRCGSIIQLTSRSVVYRKEPLTLYGLKNMCRTITMKTQD